MVARDICEGAGGGITASVQDELLHWQLGMEVGERKSWRGRKEKKSRAGRAGHQDRIASRRVETGIQPSGEVIRWPGP